MKRADGTYDNSAHLQKCHDTFNATGDKKILWEMYDDMFHLVRSVMLKEQKGFEYRDMNEDVRTIVENWLLNFVKRREKGNPYHIKERAWPTWARYSILAWKPTDQRIWTRTWQFPDISEDEYYYMEEDSATSS